MAKAYCLSCNSARVLHDGPRADSLWCFLKRGPVNAESVCDFHPAREAAMLERMAGRKMLAELAASEGRDHVLVKSDPKAHFGPFSVPESRGF